MHGFGQRVALRVPLGIGLLLVRRDGVVDEGLDALRSQVLLQCGALPGADDEQVPHMLLRASNLR